MAVQAQFYPENPTFQDYWGVNPVAGTEFEPNSGFCLQNPQQTPIYLENRGVSSAACSSSICSSIPSMAISQSLEAQILMQNHELDFILQLQNATIRDFAQENGIQGVFADEFKRRRNDLIQANRTTMELEFNLRKTEAETESWKRLAFSNEATAIDLNNTLQRVREKLGQHIVGTSAADAESSCFSCQKENPQQNRDGSGMACRNCNVKRKCVLFLPCRHLCSCKKCEVFLSSCPVCKSVKEASMEVFLV